MDQHLKEFYQQYSDESPGGHFHTVIPLHQESDISWTELKQKVPALSRGWYELARLKTNDRIEFSRDFWLSKLPYRQGLDEFLGRFFASLDDIGVFITQKKYDDPYEAHMVYSIKGNGGFFSGALPATDDALAALQKSFEGWILPNDYLIFLQIHNGFCKTTDSTGITPAEEVENNYHYLQQLQQEPIPTVKGTFVDPKKLIPFYESFGMPYYQCFLADWYPENEMGNVYYSGETKTISNFYSNASSSEVMAFPTFTDWLMFYLERVV